MSKPPYSNEPQIRVDCSEELYRQLHQMLEAWHRAQRRAKQPILLPKVDALIVQVAQARMKVNGLLIPPPSPATAATPVNEAPRELGQE